MPRPNARPPAATPRQGTNMKSFKMLGLIAGGLSVRIFDPLGEIAFAAAIATREGVDIPANDGVTP